MARKNKGEDKKCHDKGLVKRKNAQGRIVWYVRLSHNGRMCWRGSFPSKTEAREYYEDAKSQQRRDQFFPDTSKRRGVKLQTVIEDYMATNSNKTIKEDRRYAKFWIAAFPHTCLSRITPKAIESIRYELSKGRKPQTVLHYLKFLRHVLNVAVRDGKLSRNPFDQVTMPKVGKHRLRFLSLQEEARLIEAIGPDYGKWVRFAVLTGLRQGEQFKLKWTDVDRGHGLLTLPHTKSGDVQYLPLNEEARDLLKDLCSWETTNWVFPTKQGAKVDPYNFYHRIFMPAVKTAGLEGVTWHTLRHTFASRLAMSGASERDIASTLRHSTTALVGRYAHLNNSHMKGIMEKVSAFGQPRPTNPLSPKSVDKSEIAEKREEGETREGLQVVENV